MDGGFSCWDLRGQFREERRVGEKSEGRMIDDR